MEAVAAIEAGKLGQSITELDDAIAMCKELADAKASFTGKASISDPSKGRDWANFPAMSVEESAMFFAAAIQVFSARRDTIAQQLAAL